MTLDFDVEDDRSFAEMVRAARQEVLKGRPMKVCWSELADQHSFFKGIAKDGRARGEALAAVLAAVQGICRAMQIVDTARAVKVMPASLASVPPVTPSMHSSNGIPHSEAELLDRMAGGYLILYRATPVPTRQQWAACLQSQLGLPSELGNGDATARDHAIPTPLGRVLSDNALATPSTSSSHASRAIMPCTFTGYLANTCEVIRAIHQELPYSESDGEDGSFAEEKLKELVRLCISIGRRMTRSTAVLPEVARVVREMASILQDYVGSSTLEW